VFAQGSIVAGRNRRGSGWAFFCVALCLAGVSWSTRARAQSGEQPGPDANAQAVAFGRAALTAYEHGDWKAAYDAFEKAERTAHSPVFVLYLARCLRNQGALLAARSRYATVGEASPTAPEPWRRAAEEARAEAADLERRIPSVVLRVTGAKPEEVSVSVDDKPARLAGEIELDPGPHRALARRADGVETALSFVLGEAQKQTPQTLAFPVKAPAPASAPVAPPKADPERPSSPPVAAYVAGGIGLAGLAFGTVMGVIAIAKNDDIRSRCEGNVCDPSDRDEKESLSKFANLSTAGFVVGATGLATGAVLFWVGTSSSDETASSADRRGWGIELKTVF
jgi:hypothetical protein